MKESINMADLSSFKCHKLLLKILAIIFVAFKSISSLI